MQISNRDIQFVYIIYHLGAMSITHTMQKTQGPAWYIARGQWSIYHNAFRGPVYWPQKDILPIFLIILTAVSWKSLDKHDKNIKKTPGWVVTLPRKVLSLWLEARNFAHLQTEQTKLAFTAFLQTRCCVKTLSQCSMDQGFPFENKNRHKIEFSKLTPFPWNTAIPLDIPSMPPSSRYMSPRPVCAEERAVCPQSTTIQGDLKHHVEPDSQLTWCT